MISAAIYASLALHTLGQLISIYNWLRAATTVMTVLAAWGLRHKRPDLPRAFVIPGLIGDPVLKEFLIDWIPACAGMTKRNHSRIFDCAYASIKLEPDARNYLC